MTNPRTYGRPGPTPTPDPEPDPPAHRGLPAIIGQGIAWGCVATTAVLIGSGMLALIVTLWRVIL